MKERTGRDKRDTWMIKLLLAFFCAASVALAAKGVAAHGYPGQLPALAIFIFVSTAALCLVLFALYDRVPVKGFFIQAIPAILFSIGALYSGLDKKIFSGLIAITIAVAFLKIFAGEDGDAETKRRVIRIRIPWR